MSENYNEQFGEWRNRENGDITEEDVSDVSMSAENQEEPEESKEESGEEKISFAELRHGRKIPRLKKSMVLAILIGGVFVFLFFVNIFVRKDETKKPYFEEQKNYIAAENEFSLGDMEKRQMPVEDAQFYLKSPPAYLPVSDVQAPPPRAARAPSNYYSDSDLLAMKAQIGKEGGYGLALQSAVYNPPEMQQQFLPSWDEYTAQRVNDIAKLTQMTGGTSGIAGNTDRMNTGRYSEAGKYNPDNTEAGSALHYLNDNCLFPGAIIHAVLVSRIDTDYPGPIHARVTENVYDSMTGKNLLIPQGSILQGNYSSSSIGISKVQIAWESMVVNYSGMAYQVSLGGMAGVDKRGRAGIAGTLDDHYFEWLKAAGIVSLFTMLNSEIAYQTKGQSNQQIRELMDINQGIVNQIGNRLIERAMDIQPTVRVANGTALSVSVNTAVQLRPFPAIKAEEKWVRK